jgi:hypothetical protein
VQEKKEKRSAVDSDLICWYKIRMQHPVSAALARIANNDPAADLMIAFSWARKADNAERTAIAVAAENLFQRWYTSWMVRTEQMI